MRFITGVAAVAALVGGGWWVFAARSETPSTLTVPSVETSASTAQLPKLAYESPPVPIAPVLKPPRTPPAGFNEYRSEFYRFQLMYPHELAVTEYKELGSSRTITFTSTDRAFQIYITPYGGTEITEDQFRRDAPSGVIENPVDVIIDGERAVAFFGHDAALGDTREVWFIGRGFLYEVTTSRKFDAWLAEIMTTWQFL